MHMRRIAHKLNSLEQASSSYVARPREVKRAQWERYSAPTAD